MHNGKPFSDVLGEVENGELLRELTAACYEVTRAVLDVRKVGQITITLKFTPTGKGSVELDAGIAKKVPEHDRPTTTFFASDDGTLLRDDPKERAFEDVTATIGGLTGVPIHLGSIGQS